MFSDNGFTVLKGNQYTFSPASSAFRVSIAEFVSESGLATFAVEVVLPAPLFPEVLRLHVLTH